MTAETLNLFLRIARDARNWSGTPLVEVTTAQRGNLTQLKRAGLLTTFNSDGCTFASFTPAGTALAATHGIEVS